MSAKSPGNQAVTIAKNRWVQTFGSLRLAVALFIIIALACAVATLFESRFNAAVAQYYIYGAPWFTIWLVLLIVNLTCSALTRWPWKRKHWGFVTTHAGIIILIGGAWVDRQWGFEASVTLRQGQKPTNQIVLPQTILQVSSPRTGAAYLIDIPVEARPPRSNRPLEFELPDTSTRMRVVDYAPTLVREEELVASPNGSPGAVLQMQSSLMGQNVPLTLLVGREEEKVVYPFFGLAEVILYAQSIASREKDEFLGNSDKPTLALSLEEGGKVHFRLYREKKLYQQGKVEVGETFPLGWADWKVTVIGAQLEAEMLTRWVKSDVEGAPSMREMNDWNTGVFAQLIRGEEASDPFWLLSGQVAEHFFAEEKLMLGFGQRVKRLPFYVTLKNFEVPRDPGTESPADFVSTLEFSDENYNVSGIARMNHPASFPPEPWRGWVGAHYKFSQASWDPNDLSVSTLQILYDPGWLGKWIGSLLIVSGIVTMFYFKPKTNRKIDL